MTRVSVNKTIQVFGKYINVNKLNIYAQKCRYRSKRLHIGVKRKILLLERRTIMYLPDHSHKCVIYHVYVYTHNKYKFKFRDCLIN